MPGKNPVPQIAACVALLTVTITGCTTSAPYRYENIKAEYTEPAAHKNGSETAGNAPVERIANSTLTLQKVLDIARVNNPDLLMAIARIDRAQALLNKSTAPFYPRVNVYSEYMQGDAPSAYLFKTIDQRKLPPDVDFNDPGWFENYESGVSAAMNLFSGGRDSLNREIAKSGLTISQLDRDSVENQVMATAISAYYDIIAAANYITVAEASMETTRSQLRIMEVRYRSGGALKSDLLSLQVRVAEIEEIVLKSRNQERLAKAALAEILGAEPNTPFRVQEAPAYAIDVPANQLTALEYAIDHRPELSSIREKLRQSKMAVDASRAGYLPQLDFLTRYYADDPEMKYSADRANWTAAFYLNWNIFDGFATKNERAEALSQLQETLAADRKMLLAVKFDVKRAYLNLSEAEARLKVASANVATAEETFQMVKHQYDGGSADITRYLEAELAYSRARIRETTAYSDREKARAQIARSIGYWAGNRDTATREG